VRVLCPEHKALCRLSDGALLGAVLAKAQPVDFPLEGSLLGWLYNPVQVEDRRGIPRRGWTDFAGGGMGVLEDIFGAEQVFDMWMAGHPEGAALLRDIRNASPAQVQGWIRDSDYAHRQSAELAYSMWLRECVIQGRLGSLGHWPESYAELLSVISRGGDEPGLVDVAGDAAFATYLSALAHRYATRCRLTSA
jgi:hypothetical protein